MYDHGGYERSIRNLKVYMTSKNKHRLIKVSKMINLWLLCDLATNLILPPTSTLRIGICIEKLSEGLRSQSGGA